MSSRLLSHHQHAILYSLLFHMVRNQELNLAAAARGDRKGATALDHYRNMEAAVNALCRVKDGVKPVAGNTRHLLTRDEVDSVNYLGQYFSIELGLLCISGITQHAASDDEDYGGGFIKPITFDLREEFSDESSRGALVAELERWSQADPHFIAEPAGVLNRVKIALRADAVATA